MITERRIRSSQSLLLLLLLVGIFMRGVHSDLSLNITPLEEQDQEDLSESQQYLLQGDINRPTVHYIYIMETSDSTRDKDGHCGTVLECLQAFLTDLHEFVAQETSTTTISSLIVFGDHDQVVYDQQNYNDFSLYDDDTIYSSGGNRCDLALRRASQMNPTVVIFAGDGVCDRNVTNDATALGETGAVVHSIAVGDDSYCEKDFAHIPRNGGTCVSMPSSNHLSNMMLNNYLLTEKRDALQFKVDNGEYKAFSNYYDSDGAAFSATLNLSKGTSHVVCIRSEKEEKCVTITNDDSAIESKTAAANNSENKLSGSAVAGIAIGVLAAVAAALMLVLFLLWKMVFAQAKEIDTNDNSNKYLANAVQIHKEETKKQEDFDHEIL